MRLARYCVGRGDDPYLPVEDGMNREAALEALVRLLIEHRHLEHKGSKSIDWRGCGESICAITRAVLISEQERVPGHVVRITRHSEEGSKDEMYDLDCTCGYGTRGIEHTLNDAWASRNRHLRMADGLTR